MTKPSLNQLLEALVQPGPLEASRFQEALQTNFTQIKKNDYWTFYEFKLSKGPFDHGEFRCSNDGSKALLGLWPDAAKAQAESDLDLAHWGPITGIDVNPHIRPEGVDAYIYDVQGCASRSNSRTPRGGCAALPWNGGRASAKALHRRRRSGRSVGRSPRGWASA